MQRIKKDRPQNCHHQKNTPVEKKRKKVFETLRGTIRFKKDIIGPIKED